MVRQEIDHMSDALSRIVGNIIMSLKMTFRCLQLCSEMLGNVGMPKERILRDPSEIFSGTASLTNRTGHGKVLLPYFQVFRIIEAFR